MSASACLLLFEKEFLEEAMRVVNNSLIAVQDRQDIVVTDRLSTFLWQNAIPLGHWRGILHSLAWDLEFTEDEMIDVVQRHMRKKRYTVLTVEGYEVEMDESDLFISLNGRDWAVMPSAELAELIDKSAA